MRGGRLFLLLGVVVAAAAAVLLFLFLQPTTTPPGGEVLQPTPEPPRVPVVVARVDLPAGTILSDTETFLTIEQIPEPDFNAQPGGLFRSPGELMNKVTVRPLLANERISRADVIDGGLSLIMPT